jgi:hypothetical protein
MGTGIVSQRIGSFEAKVLWHEMATNYVVNFEGNRVATGSFNRSGTDQNYNVFQCGRDPSRRSFHSRVS